MFRKEHHRRSTNPIFILFRLILSLVIFAILLGGVYSAYKHFSSLDPLKIDPQSVVKELLGARTPQQLLAVLSSIKLSPKVLPVSKQILGEVSPKATQSYPSSFKFLLIADSHDDNINLNKAIAQAKQSSPDISFIIGLGDYTNVGTLDELRGVKLEFDSGNLRYFLIAGDHDLWDSRDKTQDPDINFKSVFGPLYQSFEYNGFKFLLLDNSDNYKGISDLQKQWITNELEKAQQESLKGIFVFIHEPLFHPSSDHYMGKLDKDLKSQAQSLIYQLKTAGVKKIFSGDIHYFSEYEEPVSKLPMVTVGAVTQDRNPQAPRYAIVTVYEDGSSRVDDMEIK